MIHVLNLGLSFLYRIRSLTPACRVLRFPPDSNERKAPKPDRLEAHIDMPRPNLSTPEGRAVLNAAIQKQSERCQQLGCSQRIKCHRCGEPVRIVLDGEEWCSRCQHYQRPVPHGWSKWEAVSNIDEANAS